ncbi:hypothetical protein Taro_019179 [Colocasia esculenta]|uniref:Uncharacterized protein n=1 Tax=Colocasia esculenta TaxID=4460 RepID=A0A843UT91_COLES|nr:hypothetical protein [Colocasia esculenta]
MASSRAPEGTLFTLEQFQRLSSTKASIYLGKIVDFSQFKGRLSWVEETLAATGWLRLYQISEPTFEGALKAFYLSLQVTAEGLLDCPNSRHKISEVVSMEKQKLGVIGNLGSITKKGLLVNELSAEKRILLSIISNIITPRLVCQQGTTNSQVPPAQPEYQHQQQPEVVGVQPESSSVQPEKDQAIELEQQQPALEVQPSEQQLERSDQELDPQMKEFQHCFAESERLNEYEWATAYPELSAECRKLKLSPAVFLLKGYDNLKKSTFDKWIQRYIIYYQAKDVAHSQGETEDDTYTQEDGNDQE